MDALLTALAGYGAPGLVIAALLLWLKRLQDRIDEEHRARLEDAKNYSKALQDAADERLADAKGYTDSALKLQEAVHASIDKLSELVDLTVSQSSPKKRPSSFRD